MEVRSGYKQTGVGVIPAEWEVSTLGRITECLDNLRVPLNEKQRFSRKGDYPYCGANGILDYIDGYVIDDDIILVAEDGGYFDEFKTRPIAYRMAGKCWVNNHAHILKAKVGINQNFVFYSLVHKNLLRYLASGTRAKLNHSEMDKIEIGLPKSLPEQHAISEALGDVDALLDTLTRLIAKKRDLKQAAMRQLLTGQTRLPDFAGEWKVTRLGDISEIKTGKKNNDDKIENGQYPFFVRSQTVERINSYSFDGEAILVPGEGGIGNIYHYIVGKFDYHQRVYKISNFSTEMHGKFIFFCLAELFYKKAMSNSVKATVDSLRLPTFEEFEFLAPTFDEQVAISAVLSDIDVDIAALEAHLAKFRSLKQGMMQELLTGRIRLT